MRECSQCDVWTMMDDVDHEEALLEDDECLGADDAELLESDPFGDPFDEEDDDDVLEDIG